MAAQLPPRAVPGPEALAALGRPVRVAILNHLLSAGARTASQCAQVVGETPSNCSWHLRAMAKVGLVEPADVPEGGDGRARPWRAAAVGFDFGGDDSPAAQVARTALEAASIVHENDLFHRYRSREERLPESWTSAAGAHSYALRVTPEELTDLIGAVDALIRPYVAPIRDASPTGSEVVHVTLRAFLDPDVAGDDVAGDDVAGEDAAGADGSDAGDQR